MPNCGNILIGIGAFALESGTLVVQGDTTTMCVKANCMCEDKKYD